MEESGHDPKADAGLISQKNAMLINEPIACENYNDVCLKTERLSPKYQIEDDPTVENGLMMPSTSFNSPVGESGYSKTDVHGGVVWDIFRREDVLKLTEYLNRHKHEFRHICNQPVESVIHPIHDQSMFLNESQKKQLKKEFDMEPWTFEQHLGEAVFIPSGCSHQVRNIQSCIKVALDFVAPESVEEYLRLTQEIRRLPEDHRFNEDRLEIKKIVMHAASSAIREAKAQLSCK
ncbi:unnamed protein product [Brassica oleracea var. botrytis]